MSKTSGGPSYHEWPAAEFVGRMAALVPPPSEMVYASEATQITHDARLFLQLERDAYRANPDESSRTAQLSSLPVDMEVTLLPAKIACTGTMLSVALLFPSWP